jgi:16S rRNA (cytidine1402-2'-O)-methyltransferase
MAGKLYLIPCPIVEHQLDTLPMGTVDTIHRVHHYIVERARTARRFISETQPPYAINDLSIIEMDKHDHHLFTKEMMDWLKDGKDVGIVSESGCPGIADPGARYVAVAQEKGIEVVPLVGPSSILLALMASGMNGQNFAFLGYLPVKNDALKQALRALSKTIQSTGQSQVFIETPYRNDKLLQAILKEVHPHQKLCVAVDITGPKQSIRSKSIKDWKKIKTTIGKQNCIFILGQ